MATSQARIEANRRNSKLSTGPRTAEGKDRSRANALQHGLTAKVLRTADEIAELGEATPRPPGRLGSSTLDRSWVVGQVQLHMLRLKRAGVMEERLRDRLAFRASEAWVMDQRFEVEILGAKIRRNPVEVASKLEATPQGCRWMIERWAMMARIADRDGDWSGEIRQMAFDLLGIPLEFREGPILEQIDTEGQVLNTGNDLASFARQNVDRLMAIQKSLAQRDEFDRATAQAGLAVDLGAEGQRLVRYEAELHRRLKWYCALLEQMPEDPAPHVEPVDRPVPAVEPATNGEEPAPEAPEILPVSAPNPSTIPTPSRQDRKANRVERRQLAAERKRARRRG